MGVVFGIHNWAQDAWAVSVLGNLWNDHEWTRRQYSHLSALASRPSTSFKEISESSTPPDFSVLIRMPSLLVTTLSDHFRKTVERSSEGESVQW